MGWLPDNFFFCLVCQLTWKKNYVSAKSFTPYIVRVSICFAYSFSTYIHHFSFLMDWIEGSWRWTNCSSLLQAGWCCQRDQNLCWVPISCHSQQSRHKWITDYLKAFKRLKIDNILDRDAALCSQLVLRFEVEGASINVDQHNSMREKLHDILQWLFRAWCYMVLCYVHHLNLASRNGLRSTMYLPAQRDWQWNFHFCGPLDRRQESYLPTPWLYGIYMPH